MWPEEPQLRTERGKIAMATKKSQAIEGAKPTDPVVQPRPTVGVQFVAIPEFQDLGTKVSQDISAVMTGRGTVKEALDKGQQLAEEAAKDYK